MHPIKLIVALGNPGPKYKTTRHNAGWLFFDWLREKYELPEWKFESKFQADVIHLKPEAQPAFNLHTDKLWLMQPQTFMNNSGIALGGFIQFFKIKPEEVLVIHDDKDFNFGEVRTKQGGSSAGHNGVESIAQNIGPDFHRIRIGVANDDIVKYDTADFVLERFNEEEKKALPEIFGTVEHEILKLNS